MGWIGDRLRADIRARGGTLLAVAVLVALVGAVTLAALAGARRTSTVLDRLSESAREPDTFIDASELDPARWPEIARLPSVRTAARTTFVYAFPPENDGYFPLLASADGIAGRELAYGHLVAGRRPRPSASDEIVIGVRAAERLELGVGDTLRLASLTPESAEASKEDDTIFEKPDGPAIDLRVVGLVRSRDDVAATGDDPTITILPYAFYQRYAGRVGMTDGLFLLDLTEPSALTTLPRELEATFAGGPVPSVDTGGTGRQSLRESMAVLTLGLVAFGVAVLVFGFAVVGQAVTRAVASRSAEQLPLASLGLPRRHRVVDAALPVLLVTAGGVAAAIMGAVAFSPLLPLGLAREAEPDPGLEVDILVLVVGGLSLVILFAVPVLWGSMRLAARPVMAVGAADVAGTRTRLATAFLRAGNPAMAVGVGMAWRRGRGATEVAVRTALTGVALGVAGVAAATVFGASLARVLDVPARYGWNWDASVSGDLDAAVKRPETSAVAEAVFNQTVQINGVPTNAMGLRSGRSSPRSSMGGLPLAQVRWRWRATFAVSSAPRRA